MYSINNKFTNVFDVMVYTINAMKEVGFNNIDEYIEDAISESNWNLLEVSNNKIEECNKLYSCKHKTSNNLEWYNNRDENYYSQLWNDDDLNESDFNKEDDEFLEQDAYDYLTHSSYWDTENGEDIDEAYEGFNSCHNHIWNCDIDNEVDCSYNFDF